MIDSIKGASAVRELLGTISANAALAMQKKGIAAICLNVLGGDINFGSDENEVLFLADSFSRQIDRGDKLKVAFEILELAKKL